jgi:hypothetical protein
MSKTQSEMILSHLKSKKAITPLEALTKYGCLRLAARIRDLRDSGHTILTENVTANGKRFAKYRLMQGRKAGAA